MFDGYNYTRNLVLRKLKKYKYYVCIQDFNKTVSPDIKTSPYYDINCLFGDNLTIGYKKIDNLKNSNGFGYRCQIATNTIFATEGAQTGFYSSSCDSTYNGSSFSYNVNDFVYTNLPDNDNAFPKHYSDIIADIDYTSNNNLAYNQNFMYLIPFSILLVVLALWWFRK